MAKYILVECASGEINHSVYDNIETAIADLIEFYNSVCNLYDLNEGSLTECCISEDKTEAFACATFVNYKWHDMEHLTWSWKIIEV